MLKSPQEDYNSLVEMLEAVSLRYPRRIALVFGARLITYQKLYEQTRRLAFSLGRLGVEPQDKVALWLPNCPEFVFSFFAILSLRAVVVPINSMFKREEAKFILEDSRAKLLICSVDKVEAAENLLGRLDTLKYVVSLPAPQRRSEAILDFRALVKEAAGDNFFTLDIPRQALAQILYTSGTTGKPKGACLSHANLLSNLQDCATVIKLSKRDCAICVLPLFHSFASTVCMLLPIFKGARVVIMRSVRPFKRIIRTLFKHRVTIFVGVPSFYSILAEAHFSKLQLFLNRWLNPVRLCISGASALSYEVWKRFEKKFRRPLLQGYGLTEASPVVSLNPLKGKKPDSVGLALPSVKVKVVDKEGKELAADEVGELLVKGPNVMMGYYHLEEETKKTLKDNWLYTGDLARIDRDGFIFIMGRIKEMINVRGLNVYPKEIEEFLYKHPAVKEAAVVGVEHPHRQEAPVAFVVKKREVEARELINYLRQNLASYKVPLRVFFKEELPKNPTGKILKKELQREVEHLFVK